MRNQIFKSFVGFFVLISFCFGILAFSATAPVRAAAAYKNLDYVTNEMFNLDGGGVGGGAAIGAVALAIGAYCVGAISKNDLNSIRNTSGYSSADVANAYNYMGDKGTSLSSSDYTDYDEGLTLSADYILNLMRDNSLSTSEAFPLGVAAVLSNIRGFLRANSIGGITQFKSDMANISNAVSVANSGNGFYPGLATSQYAVRALLSNEALASMDSITLEAYTSGAGAVSDTSRFTCWYNADKVPINALIWDVGESKWLYGITDGGILQHVYTVVTYIRTFYYNSGSWTYSNYSWYNSPSALSSRDFVGPESLIINNPISSLPTVLYGNYARLFVKNGDAIIGYRTREDAPVIPYTPGIITIDDAIPYYGDLDAAGVNSPTLQDVLDAIDATDSYLDVPAEALRIANPGITDVQVGDLVHTVPITTDAVDTVAVDGVTYGDGDNVPAIVFPIIAEGGNLGPIAYLMNNFVYPVAEFCHDILKALMVTDTTGYTYAYIGILTLGLAAGLISKLLL